MIKKNDAIADNQARAWPFAAVGTYTKACEPTARMYWYRAFNSVGPKWKNDNYTPQQVAEAPGQLGLVDTPTGDYVNNDCWLAFLKVKWKKGKPKECAAFAVTCLDRKPAAGPGGLPGYLGKGKWVAAEKMKQFLPFQPW